MLKITIITPAFNAEKTIEKTINSVLNQSYSGIEYIIIDGASTDKTLDIINLYSNRITKIVSEPDRGIADAYNKGIKIATGDLIGIVAADDELLPNAIQRLISRYNGTSDVVVGGIIKHDYSDKYRFYLSNPNIAQLDFETSLCHPAAYVRKEAYKTYGYYNFKYKCAIDRELLLRFYKSGASFQIIDEYLSLFHSGGISYKTPYKLSFIEDINISILYGVSKYKAYSFYVKRTFQYFIRRILETIGLWEMFCKYLRHIRYFSKKEIYEYIKLLDDRGS